MAPQRWAGQLCWSYDTKKGIAHLDSGASLDVKGVGLVFADE